MPVAAVSARRVPSEGTIRVLTLNLWGRSGAWADRRAVLIAGLRELQPDLVAFQEPIVNDAYDQVVDLLGPEYYVAHETHGLVSDGGHQGTSIASRWPFDAVHEVDLHLTPRTADFPCATLIVEVRAPEHVGQLLFVNHLPSWQLSFEHEQELQTVAAARAIEDLVDGRTLHVVLAGDFDAVPDAASTRFWSGRQALDGMSVCYMDAWEFVHPEDPGHTKTPRNPGDGQGLAVPQRIDYVFVRCGEHGGSTLTTSACALAFDQPIAGVWASDHIGVVADLVVPTSSRAT